MNHRAWFKPAFVVISGLVMVAGLSRSAEAVPAVQEVRGRWTGFFRSDVDPRIRGNLIFDITQQDHRRFTGTVTMIDPSSGAGVPFDFDGTLAESDIFTGTGKGPGGMVQFHGMLHFFSDSAAVVDAGYKFYPPDPCLPPGPCVPHDSGGAIALRSFIGDPGLEPPDVAGPWVGTYDSDAGGGTGTLRLMITQGRDPELRRRSAMFFGTEIVDEGTDHALIFNFLGSLGVPPSPIEPTPLLVIGIGDAGRFVVSGEYQPPPDDGGPATATAMYDLFFFDGSADRGSLAITQQGRSGPE